MTSANTKAGCSPVPLDPLVGHDDGCICHGNWRAIMKEMEPLIGERYRDRNGNVLVFYGVVHGGDDYYYGMAGPTGHELLSCVGSIEGYGYELLTPNAELNGGRRPSD